MIYSSACEYGIRGLTVLARQPDRRMLRSAIAAADELPEAFLGKILHDLVRAGLLTSARGRGGGYALAMPAAEIRLLDVKEAIDGLEDLERCAVGLDPCSDETPCPLHEDFKRVRKTVRDYLESTTLDDVARGVETKQALLESRNGP